MELIMSAVRAFAAFMMVTNLVLGVAGAVSTDMGFKVFLIVSPFMFIVFAATWYWAGGRIPRKRRSTLIKEAQAFFDSVNAAGSFPECRGTRVVSRPVAPVLAACKAHLYEVATQQVRNYREIGIMDETISTTKTVVYDVEDGELAITPRKLIFSSDMCIREFELHNIMSVGIEPDRIRLSLDDGQDPVSFTLDNSTLWGMLVRNLAQIQMEGRALPPGTRLQMA